MEYSLNMNLVFPELTSVVSLNRKAGRLITTEIQH